MVKINLSLKQKQAIVTGIKLNLRDANFDVRGVMYKDKDDREKYGESFEAFAKKEFEEILVNNVLIKARRIIEEYDSIIFIYNGNEARVRVENIKTFEVVRAGRANPFL